MVGFNYTYNDISQIKLSIHNYTQYWVSEYILYPLTIAIFIGLVYYAVPYLIIVNKYLREQAEKKRKKMLIKQIALQKEIDDSINND